MLIFESCFRVLEFESPVASIFSREKLSGAGHISRLDQ